MEEILKVNDLKVVIENKIITDNISFSVKKGGILGIVGESGSGKTMTSLAVMGLLPEEAEVSGSIICGETELTKLSHSQRRSINGKEVSMIFQEPMTSLNPLMKVGRQVEEMLILHTDMKKAERKQTVINMFKEVELPEPEKIYNMYPHNLSGGMRQRVMIAMALILNPSLMIADEPTTALDKEVEDEIIKLLLKLNKEKNVSIVFVSHDLGIIKEISNEVIVMKDGTIVEKGKTESIFNSPSHPYTKLLLDSVKKDKKEAEKKSENIILDVKNVSLYYKVKGKKEYIAKNINFTMNKGEILGIQGKSGCGKTTLVKSILGLRDEYDGEIICNADKKHMVFQDPYGAINPVKKIEWILSEPLKIQNKKAGGNLYTKEDIRKKTEEMIEKVGLEPEYLKRYPSQLSGGQRQRIAIAVALIGGSDFIVADEPVSALDMTIQKQVLELLLKLQKEFGLSILFISHDENVMESMCDRILRWNYEK
ncbi:MAG: ABC transporter ATP-binding protein [Lachnospiraceae bacterium]|nr:ABC transporter ATP-binding protein [Lachnospiraceae bacterium]